MASTSTLSSRAARVAVPCACPGFSQAPAPWQRCAPACCGPVPSAAASRHLKIRRLRVARWPSAPEPVAAPAPRAVGQQPGGPAVRACQWCSLAPIAGRLPLRICNQKGHYPSKADNGLSTGWRQRVTPPAWGPAGQTPWRRAQNGPCASRRRRAFAC